MKKGILSIIVLSTLFLNSCNTTTTFVKANVVNWSTIELRDDLSYEKAFNEVVDVIAKDFEMEMISKDGGYARTGWIYTWNTKRKYNEKYRNRVIIKFSADRSRVDIKSEAQVARGRDWVNGYDSALLQQIKQDIMGVVGRTTH